MLPTPFGNLGGLAARAAVAGAIAIGLQDGVMVGGAAVRTDGGTAFLARAFDLSGSDMRRLDEGGVLSRTLESADKREVATLGIVHAAVPPAFYARRLQDIVNFKRGEALLQIGTFTHPPAVDNVKGLTLERPDLGRVRGCRVGDCELQLPADLIERFQREVDWTAPGAERNGDPVMHRGLVEYVARYRRSGADGLMTYADGSTPVDVRQEFRELVGADDQVLPHFPELRQHLLTPFSASQPNISDLIYWSKEKIARKAVVTVTHLAIWRSPGGSPAHYAAASKQIYASHYFDASLGLTLLISDGGGATAGTYVAYLNRSRVDAFGGIFGGITRRLVRAKARSTLSGYLADLKVRLERDFASAGPHGG
jgi:hypothetical protein